MTTRSFLPVGAPPVATESWVNALGKLSEGLDMAQGEDRSIFRMRVQQHTEFTLAYVLRELVSLLGFKGLPPRARRELQRALANLWIERIREAAAKHAETLPDALLDMGDVESPVTNDDRQTAISYLLGRSVQAPSDNDVQLVAEVSRAELALVKLGITAEELHRARRDAGID